MMISRIGCLASGRLFQLLRLQERQREFPLKRFPGNGQVIDPAFEQEREADLSAAVMGSDNGHKEISLSFAGARLTDYVPVQIDGKALLARPKLSSRLS